MGDEGKKRKKGTIIKLGKETKVTKPVMISAAPATPQPKPKPKNDE